MRAKDSPKIKDNYKWICSTPTSLVRSAALQEVRRKGAVSLVDLVFTFKDSFLKALCVPCYSERARSGMQKPVPPSVRCPACHLILHWLLSTCHKHRGFIVYNNRVERLFSFYSCHLERLSLPDLLHRV